MKPTKQQKRKQNKKPNGMAGTQEKEPSSNKTRRTHGPICEKSLKVETARRVVSGSQNRAGKPVCERIAKVQTLCRVPGPLREMVRRDLSCSSIGGRWWIEGCQIGMCQPRGTQQMKMLLFWVLVDQPNKESRAGKMRPFASTGLGRRACRWLAQPWKGRKLGPDPVRKLDERFAQTAAVLTWATSRKATHFGGPPILTQCPMEHLP